MSTQTVYQEIKKGEWTPYNDLTDDDQQVFDQVIIGMTGVKYIPLKISKEANDGGGIRFRCISVNAIGNSVWEAFMEIRRTFGGNPYLYMILPNE